MLVLLPNQQSVDLESQQSGYSIYKQASDQWEFCFCWPTAETTKSRTSC